MNRCQGQTSMAESRQFNAQYNVITPHRYFYETKTMFLIEPVNTGLILLDEIKKYIILYIYKHWTAVILSPTDLFY